MARVESTVWFIEFWRTLAKQDDEDGQPLLTMREWTVIYAEAGR
jgi:hypothetical protein